MSLYKEMIELFNKGQMWEHALEQSRHLARQYEDEIIDYYAMAELRKQEVLRPVSCLCLV